MKNVVIYKLADSVILDEAKFADVEFTPCAGSATIKSGMVRHALAPGGGGELFVQDYSGFKVLKVQTETRRVPAPVLARAMAVRIAEFVARHARPPIRAEELELRDEVKEKLQPRAFSTYLLTPIIIAPNGLVYVGASSGSTAERATAVIRKALGSFPAWQLMFENPFISATFTDWIKAEKAPAGFAMGCDGDFASSEYGDCKVRGSSLLDDNVRSLVNDYCYVCNVIELVWDNYIRFSVTENFQLKRVAMLDWRDEEEDGTDIPADLWIAIHTIHPMVEALIITVGGLEDRTKRLPPLPPLGAL